MFDLALVRSPVGLQLGFLVEIACQVSSFRLKHS
jgi:hypothetical protein